MHDHPNRPPGVPGTLVVNEIFHSIQGESAAAGLPCVFVRLTYCNIRCTYCDTEYAFYEGARTTIDDIIAAVRAYGCKRVEITGGEPLFQPEVNALMERLCDGGFEVMLETGGSLDIGGVDGRVRRIVDFKCPSSGMEKKNLWKNAEHLSDRDEVKFVIGDRDDYDWAKGKMDEYRLDVRCPILMSVVFGKLEPVTLSEWI